MRDRTDSYFWLCVVSLLAGALAIGTALYVIITTRDEIGRLGRVMNLTTAAYERCRDEMGYRDTPCIGRYCPKVGAP